MILVERRNAADGTPLEAVFNVFPSQQWHLSSEWDVD
jgi:hypothetical protein